MVYSDDFLSPQDRCEICGAELQDEVVIQEFADGSLARLCPECAAGTALDDSLVVEPEPFEEKPAKRRRGFRLRGGGRSKATRREEEPFDLQPFDLEPFESEPFRTEPASLEHEVESEGHDSGRALFDAEALDPEARPATPAGSGPAATPGTRGGAPARQGALSPGAVEVDGAPAADTAPPEPAHPWPPVPPVTEGGALLLTEEDLLDRTRELLLPVTDLISLQGEVQSALERLAASLERFASEMVTDSHEKAHLINSRLQTLEHELDVTRSRLREAEALLPEAAVLEAKVKAEPSAWPEEVRPVTRESLVAESRAALELAELVEASEAAEKVEAPKAAEIAQGAADLTKPGAPTTPEAPALEGAETVEMKPPWTEEVFVVDKAVVLDEAAALDEVILSDDTVASPEALPTGGFSRPTEADLAAEADRSAEDYLATGAVPPARPSRRPRSRPVPPPGTAKPVSRAPAPSRRPGEAAQTTGTFRIDEVQAAQRYYNESAFVSRIRDVRRSLGKPKASVARLTGEPPRAVVTIFWDIVWYQYLVDLRRDLPSSEPRVVLQGEGMDLDALAFDFKQKNATVNDDGRLDASELEVRLLSDPSALITEMNSEETKALEDATEEIWNQKGTPEFKWDD